MSTLAPPDPDSQHMRALTRANEVRLARARLKERIHKGRQDVRTILIDPPDYVDSMPVADLLKAMWRVGDQRVAKWLAEAGVSQRATLGTGYTGLTTRQRLALVALLDQKGRQR